MTCDVYRDLLVPFMEGTCSPDSKKMVEGHLAECEACRRELERYQAELLPTENAQTRQQEYRQAQKPFRRIAGYIRRLWAAIFVLVLLLGVIGAYFTVAYRQGYYTADRLFFRVRDERIMSSELRATTEQMFRLMYRKIYFRILDREQYYMQKASVEEIMAKYRELDTLRFDWEHAEVEAYSLDENGFLEIKVPVTVEGDDVPMAMELYASRVGIGRYFFTQMRILRMDVRELGYLYLPYLSVLTDDSLKLWPAFLELEIHVNALRPDTGRETAAESDDTPVMCEDTGKTLTPGVYRYECVQDNGESWYEEITVYPNQTLTRHRSNADRPMRSIDDMQELHLLREIPKPVRYFIVRDEEGAERLFVLYNFGSQMDSKKGIIIKDIAEKQFSLRYGIGWSEYHRVEE